ncbi:Spc97 / Spc98 family of spindle pole body (SBP)component [Striga asiatica]|uniref:Spc97 / Spc98 family of spindle pole body (SBP)component n=1 Tax=Striga asiatica TaxID=4170 RepID=A0A5A7PQ67_STRAF|nr:Spc97 / Spc98 family of spindle pole body (SBP)component [Striga asiatica]
MASNRVKVLLHYGGLFSGGSYLGGVAELMRMNYGRQMYSEVVCRAQAILKANPCNFEYILWTVFDGMERPVKMKIESNDDILEQIEVQGNLNIYLDSAFSHKAPYSYQAGPSSFTFTHTGYPRDADDPTAGCSNQPGHSRDDDNNDDQTNTHNDDSSDEDKEVNEKQMFKLFRAWYCEHIEELRLITDHIKAESLAYKNPGSTRQSDIEQRMWSLHMTPTTTRSDRQPIHLPLNNLELSLGSVFLSKDELICAIQLYHLQQKVECRTPKSCTSRLTSIYRQIPRRYVHGELLSKCGRSMVCRSATTCPSEQDTVFLKNFMGVIKNHGGGFPVTCTCCGFVIQVQLLNCDGMARKNTRALCLLQPHWTGITKSFPSQLALVLDIFYKVAYCYRREDFFRYLSAIQSQKLEAFRKLTNEIPFEQQTPMGQDVTRLLVVGCVRATIEKWFAVRRASAEGRNHPLTQWTQLRLDPLFKKDLLPCLHASTAIREAGLDIMDFVNDHYKTYSVAKMYQSTINPVLHPDEWHLPPKIMRIKVIPLNDPKQAGRPQTQRYSAGEGSSRRVRRQQMCSRRRVTGHNRAKYPLYDGDNDFFFLNEEGQNAPTPHPRTTSRRPRRCRTCKETGHKSSSCPSRPFHDNLDEDGDVM